jgi:hypothetical protein
MTTETRRLIGEIREYLADLERKLDRRRLEAGLDNLEPLTEEEEAWVRSANASADKLAAGMAAGLGVPDVVNWRGDVQGRTFAILDGVEVEVTDPEPRELAPRDGASPTIAERNQAAQDEAHRIRRKSRRPGHNHPRDSLCLIITCPRGAYDAGRDDALDRRCVVPQRGMYGEPHDA